MQVRSQGEADMTYVTSFYIVAASKHSQVSKILSEWLCQIFVMEVVIMSISSKYQMLPLKLVLLFPINEEAYLFRSLYDKTRSLGSSH